MEKEKPDYKEIKRLIGRVWLLDRLLWLSAVIFTQMAMEHLAMVDHASVYALVYMIFGAILVRLPSKQKMFMKEKFGNKQSLEE